MDQRMNKLPFKMICETDIERYRAESFFDKEPETITWIDSFEKSDVLIDIGANVGIYTLYAASKISYVYAIEPVLLNFNRLNENIELNDFKNVSCLNLAMGAETCMQRLHIPNVIVGASGAQTNKPKDEHGKSFQPAKEVMVLQVSLRFLSKIINIFSRRLNIKIDIDGHEEELVEDLLKVRPKSFLIEYNGNDIDDMRNYFEEHFYTEILTDIPRSDARREHEGIKARNLIFQRDDEL